MFKLFDLQFQLVKVTEECYRVVPTVRNGQVIKGQAISDQSPL